MRPADRGEVRAGVGPRPAGPRGCAVNSHPGPRFPALPPGSATRPLGSVPAFPSGARRRVSYRNAGRPRRLPRGLSGLHLFLKSCDAEGPRHFGGCGRRKALEAETPSLGSSNCFLGRCPPVRER